MAKVPGGSEKKKKKKPAPPPKPEGPDPRLLLGIGGAVGLLLVIGLAVVLVRGLGGGGGDPEGAGEEMAGPTKGTLLSGAKVVFTEPPPGPGREKLVDPPRIEPPPPTSGGSTVGSSEFGPWQGQPDPPAEAPEPVPEKTSLGLLNGQAPLLASLGGPFVLEHRGNQSTQRDNPELDKDPNSTLKVKDLRTGKDAARFHWKTPAWTFVRISPDARYIVGPDNKEGVPGTRVDGLLFVWETDKIGPAGQLKIPGALTWFDFVAKDRIAALVFEEGKPAVHVWNVTNPEPIARIALPEKEFSPPESDQNVYRKPEPGEKTYAPDPAIGAVSPGGRYVALGGTTAVHVVSVAEGKSVGALPVPRKQLWGGGEIKPHTYHGFAFDDAGENLTGLLQSFKGWLVTWSLTSGLSRHVVRLDVPEVKGPPLPGPEPDTVILPSWTFDNETFQRLTTQAGPPFTTGAVVDARTGKAIVPIPSLPFRRNGTGVVALSDYKRNPEAPDPYWFKPGIVPGLDKSSYRDHWLIKVEPLDREAIQKGRTGGESLQPTAKPGDRADLASKKPEPPAQWTSPPAAPEPPSGLIGAYNVPGTPPLFGDVHVGFLANYMPPEDPALLDKLRFEARMAGQKGKAANEQLLAMTPKIQGPLWLRYDMRTGKLVDPPIQLGPMNSAIAGQAPPFDKEPVAAAMTRDASKLAVRDAADLSRVDVWDATGARILSFIPYTAATPVHWVGWSPQGRLLTVADGKFTIWDVPAGKAVAEVDGSYQLPVQPSRDRAWLAVSGGAHFDLLDAETGACLGRCALSGTEHDPKLPTSIGIPPDNTRLFCMAWRAKQDIEGAGVLFSWDLKTGEAQKPMVVKSVPWGSLLALDKHHLLLGGVFDIRLGMAYLQYRMPTFKSPSYMEYSNGVQGGATDGRLWTFGPENPHESTQVQRMMLRRVEYPGYADGPTNPADVFTRETPLTVEVDMGEKSRSEAFGKNLVRNIHAQGFKIGTGGWTLRATAAVQDTDASLTMKEWGNKVSIPRIQVSYKLYAPNGELAHTTGEGLEFGTGGKYFTGQKKTQKTWDTVEIEFNYEFKDKDPHTAMTDELLEALTRAGSVRLNADIGKVRGKYELLPLAVETQYAPVPTP